MHIMVGTIMIPITPISISIQDVPCTGASISVGDILAGDLDSPTGILTTADTTLHTVGAMEVIMIPGIPAMVGVDITVVTTDGAIPRMDGVILTTEDPTGPDTTMVTIMDTGIATITEVDGTCFTEGWITGTITDIPGPPTWCTEEPRVLPTVMPVIAAVADPPLRVPE